ncbi:kinase-like domain-containing protein [Rhizophagus irregularis DAOM 181602=DAOM 197198]|nr:kinase-like domain-containing protein [Rhizophagus irregularis DAOM 181602=DAOM 197198]
MSVIREEIAFAAANRSSALINYNVHNDIHKQHEFKKQTILTDNFLTKDEKTYAINWLTRGYDRDKILNNSGPKRTCENSDWIDGRYDEWDSKKQQLKRFGRLKVILKGLENVESANKSWFEEAKSHLTIEPRNATEEELEAFHSRSYDFNIPNNIDDFNKSSNKNDDSMMSNINSKTNSDKLSKVFRKLQINDETMQQTKEPNIVNYNDEIYNNPNLHSEVQNELEIPDDI